MKAQTPVIPIDKIIIDQKFYPRFQTDQQRVQEFVEAMAYDEYFPPIKVVCDEKTGRYILLDGKHRLEARTIRGETTIEVFIFNIPKEHLLLNAARLNDKHSKPLSPDEIKHVIISAWRNGVKDTDDIARELGRSQRYIEMVLKPVRDEERNQRDTKILELYRQGMSQREIASEMRLSPACINKAIKLNDICKEDNKQKLNEDINNIEPNRTIEVFTKRNDFVSRTLNESIHIKMLDNYTKDSESDFIPPEHRKTLTHDFLSGQDNDTVKNQIGFVSNEQKNSDNTNKVFTKRNDFVSRTPDKSNNIRLLSETPIKTSPESTPEISPSTEESYPKDEISSAQKSPYPTYLDQINLYNELPQKSRHAMRAMELAKAYKLDIIDIIKEIHEPAIWTKKVLVAALALSLMDGNPMDDASHVETALGIGFEVARTVQGALSFNKMLCPVSPDMAQWIEENISARDLELIATLTGAPKNDLPYLLKGEAPPAKKPHFEKLPDGYKDHLQANVLVLREIRTHTKNQMFSRDSAKQLLGHLNKNVTVMNEIFEALRELQIF